METHDTMTIDEGFEAFFVFLHRHWEVAKDEEFGVILSAMQMHMPRKPWDPAYWRDWEEAVASAKLGGAKTLMYREPNSFDPLIFGCIRAGAGSLLPSRLGKCDIAEGDIESMTIDEAFAAMFLFLLRYWEIGKSVEVAIVLSCMQMNGLREPCDPNYWTAWKRAVADAKAGRVKPLIHREPHTTDPNNPEYR